MLRAIGALAFSRRGQSSPLARGVPVGRGVVIALCSLLSALYEKNGALPRLLFPNLQIWARGA